MNTKELYIKGIKKADRDMNLGNGWVAKDKPHKNKKKYDRKNFKMNIYGL